MNNDVELVSKALAEFSAVEAGLQALRERFTGVVFDVTTTKGMDEAREARLVLRGPRYEVERIRKAAKAPILALGKKLDADAARITAEIEKLEGPIDRQIKAEEARKEAERQAKLAAEAARVRAIQERIAELRGCQMLTPTSGAALISEHIADLEAIAVDESFAEFREQAAATKAAGLERLQSLHAAAVTHEAEQARLVAEREELARLRAEQEARDRAERERIAAEERAAREVLEAQRRKIDAEAAAERKRLDDERVAQERAAAAEAQSLADERASFEREKAEAARLKDSTSQCDVECLPDEPLVAGSPGTAPPRPSDLEIVQAIAWAFGVTLKTAAAWLDWPIPVTAATN